MTTGISPRCLSQSEGDEASSEHTRTGLLLLYPGERKNRSIGILLAAPIKRPYEYIIYYLHVDFKLLPIICSILKICLH